MKVRIVAMLSLVAALGFAMAITPFSFATALPSGQVNYFNVSGGVCTSTAWTAPILSDGNVPGMFRNNVGGPPMTAVVGTGSICVQVVLSGATPSTAYVITATKMSGSLTVTTDASGSGSNEAVFTSTYTGTCTTDPLKMNPSSPFDLNAGQINHVWVGTGCGANGVPEFPIAGSLGLLLVVAIAVPLLVAARKWRSPIQIA